MPVTTEGTQENGQDDTQENQVITFQRTVTVKAAVEENALYEASDLVLKLAAEEYDLTEGIIYDSNCYKLNIVDIGDFDIDTLGDYEGKLLPCSDWRCFKAKKNQMIKTVLIWGTVQMN